MDHISLKNIKIFAHHGVYEEEKIKGQNFFVDLNLYFDMHKAGVSDCLQDTVNYGEIAVDVSEFLKEHTYDLLEKAAESVAGELLIKYPMLDLVDITIHKPQAPIPLEFEDVSVNITRGWKRAVLAVGSNMGEREVYIKEALCKLQKDEKIKNLICSEIITSKPYGNVNQEDFLNGALIIKTLYTPHELLERLHELENEANRKREIHWGPRTLDLDIIFYEDDIVFDKDLIIPHPDMENREFVLKPLLELAPCLIHPVYKKTVKQLYEELCHKNEKTNKS